jgi:hypothetical protein
VYENEVLRKIFGCKREEVVGRFRGLRNENLRNLDASPCCTRVKEDEIGRARSTDGKEVASVLN